MKKTFLGLIFACIASIVWGQNNRFQNDNRLNWNSVRLSFADNPAFAGWQGGHIGAFSFGLPYAGISKTNKSALRKEMQGSFETVFRSQKKFAIGLGVVVQHNVEAFESRTDAALALGGHVRLGEDHRISFGLSAVLHYWTLDFTKLRFVNQINPFYPDILPTSGESFNESQLRFDANFGLYYQWKNLTAGFAVQNITTPQNKYILSGTTENSALPRVFRFDAAYYIPLNKERLGLTPSAALFYEPRTRTIAFDGSVLLTIQNRFMVGVSGRLRSAGVQAGVRIIPALRLDYRYEYYFNEISAYSSGSHQIALRVFFPAAKKYTKGVPFIKNNPEIK